MTVRKQLVELIRYHEDEFDCSPVLIDLSDDLRKPLITEIAASFYGISTSPLTDINAFQGIKIRHIDGVGTMQAASRVRRAISL